MITIAWLLKFENPTVALGLRHEFILPYCKDEDEDEDVLLHWIDGIYHGSLFDVRTGQGCDEYPGAGW